MADPKFPGSPLNGRPRPRLFPWCLALATVLAGCSRPAGRVPVYPVAGRVAVTGEVPEGALVVLHASQGDAKDLRPSGKVFKDGSFRVTTYDADDGAPAGEYKVTVHWN